MRPQLKLSSPKYDTLLKWCYCIFSLAILNTTSALLFPSFSMALLCINHLKRFLSNCLFSHHKRKNLFFLIKLVTLFIPVGRAARMLYMENLRYLHILVLCGGNGNGWCFLKTTTVCIPRIESRPLSTTTVACIRLHRIRITYLSKPLRSLSD